MRVNNRNRETGASNEYPIYFTAKKETGAVTNYQKLFDSFQLFGYHS